MKDCRECLHSRHTSSGLGMNCAADAIPKPTTYMRAKHGPCGIPGKLFRSKVPPAKAQP